VDIGVLFTFAVGSLAVYGVILGGWSSNNKYSILGSLRSSAQIISYEIPLGMSILSLLLYSGSLNLEKMIDWQAHHGWERALPPAGVRHVPDQRLRRVQPACRSNLPEAEQELVGGYHTEYSSIKFGLFLPGRVRPHDHHQFPGRRTVLWRLGVLRLDHRPRVVSHGFEVPGDPREGLLLFICSTWWSAGRCRGSASTSSWASPGRC